MQIRRCTVHLNGDRFLAVWIRCKDACVFCNGLCEVLGGKEHIGAGCDAICILGILSQDLISRSEDCICIRFCLCLVVLLVGCRQNVLEAGKLTAIKSRCLCEVLTRSCKVTLVEELYATVGVEDCRVFRIRCGIYELGVLRNQHLDILGAAGAFKCENAEALNFGLVGRRGRSRRKKGIKVGDGFCELLGIEACTSTAFKGIDVATLCGQERGIRGNRSIELTLQGKAICAHEQHVCLTRGNRQRLVRCAEGKIQVCTRLVIGEGECSRGEVMPHHSIVWIRCKIGLVVCNGRTRISRHHFHVGHCTELVDIFASRRASLCDVAGVCADCARVILYLQLYGSEVFDDGDIRWLERNKGLVVCNRKVKLSGLEERRCASLKGIRILWIGLYAFGQISDGWFIFLLGEQ